MRDGSMHLVDGNRRAIWPYWARIDIRYDNLSPTATWAGTFGTRRHGELRG